MITFFKDENNYCIKFFNTENFTELIDLCKQNYLKYDKE